MLLHLLYEIAVWILFVISLPKAIYQAICQKKYRQSFLHRFGYKFPQVQRKGSAPIFWVHAVSVGETQAISSLVKRIKDEVTDAVVVVSSVSETGYATAKRVMPYADYHVFLPFDFFLSVSHVLSRCRPDVVILSETDYWFRFLHKAKQRGAVIMVASGKISENSHKLFKRFSFFAKRLFALVDFFCLQSEQEHNRFVDLGIAKAKLNVTGNVKSDVQYPVLQENEKQELRKKLRLQKDDCVLVVGSTHAPEEELVLRELASLLKEHANLKIIIVPRHPERFSQVQSLIDQTGIPNTSLSKCSEKPEINPKVVLVDAMGTLVKCYQLADIAIVAGSFTDKVGGHNILEPAFFGVPVICGPHMFSQKQLLEIAQSYDAVVQVDGTKLSDTVREFIVNSAKRKKMGDQGLTMVSALRGASERTFQALTALTPQFFSARKQ
jgi:3-deoxy-D-manno-octulosonic-acid transferase